MTTPNLDSDLEQAILSLLASRGGDKTICPSEAAKKVAADSGAPEAWLTLMGSATAAAHRLALAGRIVITQRGRTVAPAAARGPIRLKLRA